MQPSYNCPICQGSLKEHTYENRMYHCSACHYTVLLSKDGEKEIESIFCDDISHGELRKIIIDIYYPFNYSTIYAKTEKKDSQFLVLNDILKMDFPLMEKMKSKIDVLFLFA